MPQEALELRNMLRGFTHKSSQHLLDYVQLLEQERAGRNPPPRLSLPKQRFVRQSIRAKLGVLDPYGKSAVVDYAKYLQRCQRAQNSQRAIPANRKVSWWAPTPQAIVIEALRLAEVTPRDVVFDLGCGDGRVVADAARFFGARAVGFDIDPAKVRQARKRVRVKGVADLVQVRKQSMLAIPDLYKATVLYLYLTQRALNRVIPILKRRCRPGTRLVTVDTWNRRWAPEKEMRVVVRQYRWRIGLWYV
jgi:SAM-dependent methyltransferase